MRRKKINYKRSVVNLRRLMPLLALFLCLSCSKNDKLENSKEITEENSVRKTKANAITDPNEQNANKNWKWDDPALTTVKLYFKPKVNNQPSPSIERPLPWFTFGNPVNNSDKDYRSELGWELYLKDFGTPDRPAQTPFFALYNKYSGVLRFFVYNFRTQDLNENSKTYYIGKLRYTDPDKHNGALSFLASPDQFIVDKEDKNLSIVSVTKKQSSDVWMNFDFLLAKPASSSFGDVVLTLSVFGANETELNLGSDFSNITAKSVVGGAAGNTSNFANFINKGVEYTTSGGSFLESINKLLEKAPNVSTSSTKALSENTTAISKPRAAVPVATIAAGVSVIKGLFGFVKSFIGGSKSSTGTQALQYNGIVNTTGTATLSNNLYNIQFSLDHTSPLSSGYYKPLYDYSIGLLRAFSPPDHQSGTKLFYEESNYRGCSSSWPFEPVQEGRYSIKHQSLWMYWYDFVDENRGLAQSVRLDSIKITLLNRKYFGENYESSFLYFPIVSQPKYEPYNEGTIDGSRNSGWRQFYPFTQEGQEYFHVKKWYSRTDVMTDALLSDANQNIKPALGIYIKFTITDPKYPDSESRERVIYKVVELFKTGKRNSSVPGCPVPTYY